MLANLGGASAASQTMLLGREYYQTSFGETALVLTPITVHILSGLLKRLLSSNPKDEPRPISRPLAWTGYATALLFLPIHFLSHRADPTTEAPPIFAVGPAELDFEFVKLGLQRFPVRSWVLYGGLVLFTAVHAVDGLAILWNTYLKPYFNGASVGGSRRRNWAIGGIVIPVMTGLYFVSQEPLMTFTSTANRYMASLTSSIIYRV
ncbi:hypothetical protein CC1G_09150 [Coprinopsis cinerea okayama7|uniref:Mitochondrial adapter protein MCP1 transmembrane domain-containing protein n=1 Tax=Coprinopsis cinerea (strain Okayama-7 / 130 / ATCC MYA-4618 / FGSC 9003) TaxID=240176 RepID=A8P9Q7_COPC7|nr:hypothetical protein CC1G_09150 [Coprinopsis cinerea okayama7\|eukprot:XP_001839816.1 hypothetical protein CC1G_09150 [Coprinopsis cinerea okayama7\